MKNEIHSRIGRWIEYFRKTQARRSIESLIGRGQFGKDFEALLNETNKSEVDLTPRTAMPIEMPYEIEKRLSNWPDCIDWIKDNLDNFKVNRADLYELILNDLDKGTI